MTHELGPQGSVLVVEDDESIRELLLRTLLRGDFAVATAGTAAKALELASAHHFSVIVSDLGLPDMPGEEMLRALRRSGVRSRLVVLSGWPQDVLGAKLDGMEVDKVFFKPTSLTEVLGSVRELVLATPSPASPIVSKEG